MKNNGIKLNILVVTFVFALLVVSFFFFIEKSKDSGDIIKKAKEDDIDLIEYGTYPPYDLPKSFFKESLFGLPDVVISKDTKISGITVNHHLLGSRLIARTFDNISYLNPKTVVLLSPNHFNIGSAPAISSKYNWETHYGLLESDASMIEEMVSLGLININENPFPEEHGISGLTSYIKYTFPNTQFVPIIFHNQIEKNHILQLSSYFSQFDIDDILIIASLDFSHDSTSEVADTRDKISIDTIKSMEIENIKEVEVDSRPALMILLDYSIKKEARKFNLLDNTNSAKLTNSPHITDATSYINCYFSK